MHKADKPSPPLSLQQTDSEDIKQEKFIVLVDAKCCGKKKQGEVTVSWERCGGLK